MVCIYTLQDVLQQYIVLQPPDISIICRQSETGCLSSSSSLSIIALSRDLYYILLHSLSRLCFLLRFAASSVLC